jgi:hypothetical protein
VRASDFPRAGGRTLEQIANTIESGPQVGLATSVFTPGRNRFAFGVIDSQQRFVLAKSAVYLARRPNDRALGPFPAPAYSMETAPRFRSRTVAGDSAAPKAIYAAHVPLKDAGRYSVVVASRVGGRLVGAISQLWRPTARYRDPETDRRRSTRRRSPRSAARSRRSRRACRRTACTRSASGTLWGGGRRRCSSPPGAVRVAHLRAGR